MILHANWLRTPIGSVQLCATWIFIITPPRLRLTYTYDYCNTRPLMLLYLHVCERAAPFLSSYILNPLALCLLYELSLSSSSQSSSSILYLNVPRSAPVPSLWSCCYQSEVTCFFRSSLFFDNAIRTTDSYETYALTCIQMNRATCAHQSSVTLLPQFSNKLGLFTYSYLPSL